MNLVTKLTNEKNFNFVEKGGYHAHTHIVPAQVCLCASVATAGNLNPLFVEKILSLPL